MEGRKGGLGGLARPRGGMTCPRSQTLKVELGSLLSRPRVSLTSTVPAGPSEGVRAGEKSVSIKGVQLQRAERLCKGTSGIAAMVQWIKNQTAASRDAAEACLIPGLVQWVKGSSFAAVSAERQSLVLELPYDMGVAIKKGTPAFQGEVPT